jgi:hypothetical protein
MRTSQTGLRWGLMLIYCAFVHASFEVATSGVDVDAPQRVPGQTEWVASVHISQAVGSVVLVLLTDVGQRAYQPCTEFSALCCIGLQLRGHVWGGDVLVLDAVQTACQQINGEPWGTALAPLASRNHTDLRFDMSDVQDPWRGRYVFDGWYEVQVLALVIDVWSGCTDKSDDLCTVRLQSIEQILQVDTSTAQQLAIVSSPKQCSTAKPPDALWFPIDTSGGPPVCVWFCGPRFTRCPGHSTDSVASCWLLPDVGAVLHTTVGLTWLNAGYLRDRVSVGSFDIGSELDAFSHAVATRMTTAGVLGVYECTVIIRETLNVSAEVARVDLPSVKGNIRVLQDFYYDGVRLREGSSGDVQPLQIPTELRDEDDRLAPGFFEFTVLLYSNDTVHSLSEQAVLLRYVLFDALNTVDHVEDVFYIGDVTGVIRGVAAADMTHISIIEAVALILWICAILVLSIVAMCFQRSDVDSRDGCCSAPCVCRCTGVRPIDEIVPAVYCAQHSPRDRVLISILVVLIASTLVGTGVVYVSVILPRLEYVDTFERPMFVLGWLWFMLGMSIVLVLICCLVMGRVRRHVWTGI